MHVEQITTPNSILVYNMWKIMKRKLNLAVIWKCNRVLVLRRTLFLPWLSSFTVYVVLILPQTNTLFYSVLVFFIILLYMYISFDTSFTHLEPSLAVDEVLQILTYMYMYAWCLRPCQWNFFIVLTNNVKWDLRF